MTARLTTVSAITLGVDDLERSLRFYRDGLGLPTTGIVGENFENGAVVFFELQRGLKLALFERRKLALDAGLAESASGPAGSSGSGNAGEFALAHNVAAKEDVDALLAQAARAGATITKPAQNAFWGGYAGYFLDPDGHLWEVAWNPHWPLAEADSSPAGSGDEPFLTFL